LWILRLRAHQRLAVCLAAVLLASGCGDGDEESQRADGVRDKVTYVTGLGTFGRESYAWVAREKGFFAEQGIDVEIKPGAAGDVNLRLVEAGHAQFAVIDYAGAVDRAGNGQFGKFRLVAGLNTQTLIAVMSVSGRGIATPRDLEGKTVGVAHGAVPGTLFPLYASLAGIDHRKVKIVGMDKSVLISSLASGKVDAIGQFVTGQPSVVAAAKGRQVVVLPYSNYLTDLYGNALVTTANLAAVDPDLVRRFTTALLKGLAYAVDHPEEAGQILHKAVPAQDAKTAAAEVALLKSYVGAREGLPLGTFSRERVARGIAVMQSGGQIPLNGLVPDDFVDFSVMSGARVEPARWLEPAA
jgi:NitT/TauT family transport system substrate-binding protein